MTREFAVIGLGVFGRTVALHLTSLGHEVLGIDSDEEAIAACADELAMAVCADATDEAALRELHVQRMSCAVVAIGAESIEASILATTLLRQIGVPEIVARSLGSLHGRVLRAVGASRVVRPEEEMGERVARQLSEPNVLERLELGEDAEVAEVEVPAELVGKSPVELNLRKRAGVSVVAFRRGRRVVATLDGSEVFQAGDVVLVIGRSDDVAAFAKRT